MTTFTAMAVGTVPMLATGVAVAQTASMMSGEGSMWGFGGMGGYAGAWVPILVVVVVAALVALVVQRRGKRNPRRHQGAVPDRPRLGRPRR